MTQVKLKDYHPEHDTIIYDELRLAVDKLNETTIAALDKTRVLYADGMRDIMVIMKKRSAGHDAIILLQHFIEQNLISWPYLSEVGKHEKH